MRLSHIFCLAISRSWERWRPRRHAREAYPRRFKSIVFVALLFACASQSAMADGMRVRNGLPPTCMDSFVKSAGDRADLIYGDEGRYREPPYFGFTKEHRINAGIIGQSDAGLTTGHGDMLPDAWGRDEFLGQEWSQGGKNGGQYDAAVTPSLPPAPSYSAPSAGLRPATVSGADMSGFDLSSGF